MDPFSSRSSDRAAPGAAPLLQRHECAVDRQGEPAARTAQRFSQAMLDAIAAQVCVLDERGRIIAVNAAWRAFAAANGAGAEVSEGANYFEVCSAAAGAHADEAAPMLAGMRRLVEGTATSFALEYPCDAPSERRWFNASVTRFFEGPLVRLVVAHHDVSALKRATLALQLSNERFETALSISSVVVFSQDRDLRYVWVHHPSRPLVDLIGRRDTEIFEVPAEGAASEALKREVLTTGVRQRRELIVHQEGVALTFDVTVDAQHDLNGAVVGVVGAAVDITERKVLEERASRMERFAAVGTLVGGLAHEINNPLVVVLSNLEFAGDELRRVADGAGTGPATSPELPEALADATAGAQRIKELINALRVIAPHPGAEARSEVKRAIDLAMTIARRQLARCAEVTVEVPALPCVRLAEADLVQVLVNLLINAGQATGERPNRLRISGAQRDDGRLVIRVEDSGSGMEPAVLRRAFDPFFSTRPVGSGQGLGLALCRGIVLAAGGDLQLESTVGRGTTACVVLPEADGG